MMTGAELEAERVRAKRREDERERKAFELAISLDGLQPTDIKRVTRKFLPNFNIC